jgi:hypothetical protein
LIISQDNNNLKLNKRDKGMKELHNRKSSNAFKFFLNLQNASYLENIIKIAVMDFNKASSLKPRLIVIDMWPWTSVLNSLVG